ncbi:MAG: FAD-dependent oxidoreductase [Zetaproteobacteria bacterium]|nr:MAG: FAD-dependent oxidoreductase [Zetaproteobacteria bacterium]
MPSVAVIGGGLAGLSCAIELARQGMDVDLFEAAPVLGGRTRSMFDAVTATWFDNGPHLLVGAYHATRNWLDSCGLESCIHWQPTLRLSLWEAQRGHFDLAPQANLPLWLALPVALVRLQGHGWQDLPALSRLLSCHPHVGETVEAWMKRLHVPAPLARDLLTPLCLGAMNESPSTADANSFSRVLRLSFANHEHARLGWFRAPLQKALIDPLDLLARDLGVRIHLQTRITTIEGRRGHMTLGDRQGRQWQANLVVDTKPDTRGPSRPITSIHLWFEQNIRLPNPMIGGLGTTGHWFFDTSQQMNERNNLAHLAVVISASAPKQKNELVRQVCSEIGSMLDMPPPEPFHHRIICERRATRLVQSRSKSTYPDGIIPAGEAPVPGELPATIELAVQRGIGAARRADMLLHA